MVVQYYGLSDYIISDRRAILYLNSGFQFIISSISRDDFLSHVTLGQIGRQNEKYHNRDIFLCLCKLESE